MRIEQLEYVTAVTQSGSLRRASERLHISLPALSQAITKLEREIGVSLLDRRRSGARISRQGQELLHRLLDGELPQTTHTTDGAEMGKLMVSEGLGVTVLPDYSVLGDPMERAGLITCRPIAGDDTTVMLMLQQRRAPQVAAAVRELIAALLAQARAA